MRVRRVCLLIGMAVLLLGMQSGTVSAQEESMPFGKYVGSAAGGNPGSKPIALTLYVNPGANGAFELTFSTPAIPIPISVTGTPQQAGNGYDVPVSVNLSSVRLTGSGTLRLRMRDGQWVAYGTGSGSFRDKSGSGSASARPVGGASSSGQQVIDAIGGFFGGPPEPTDISPPEVFSEDGDATQPGDSLTDVGSELSEAEPPPTEAVESEVVESEAIAVEADPPVSDDALITMFILALILGLWFLIF